MYRRATAVRLELVDPSRRMDKFYTAYSLELGNGSYAVRSHYGPRTGKGTLTRADSYRSEPDALFARSELIATKERKGYHIVEPWTSFAIPPGVDLNGPAGTVLPVIADAFTAALRHRHRDMIAALARVTKLGRGSADLGTRTVVALSNLPGQLATRPWGPDLAAALEGLPRVDGYPGKSPYPTSLIIAPRDLARWLMDHYSDGLLVATPPLSVAAAPGDTEEVLTTAMKLEGPWTAPGPYSRLIDALETARLIMAPSA